MVFDLGNKFRGSAGMEKIVIAAGPTETIGFNYLIELLNENHTQKKIFLNTIHKIGEKILDVSTGINGEVLAVEEIQRRDLD